MGFRINFFGMAVERRRPRAFFFIYFTHLRVNEILFRFGNTVLSGIKCNQLECNTLFRIQISPTK